MDDVFWETLGITCTIGNDGFPIPGELLKQEREKRGLTQADVAMLLGVSRTMVTKMEKNNDGFDSIATRRQVAQVLGILPLALGIVETGGIHVQTLYDTTLLQNMLYKDREVYFTGGDTGGLTGVGQTISSIFGISTNLNHNNSDVLEILCHYHQLALDIAREEGNDAAADSHAKSAFSLARLLHSKPLKAATLLRYCAALVERGDLQTAQTMANRVLKYADDVPRNVAGAIYIHASLPYAELHDSRAIEFAERGYNISKEKRINAEDPCFLKLTTPFAHYRLAQAVLETGKPQEALDMLNKAEEATEPRFARRLVSIKALQGQALLALGEYPQAADVVQDAASLAIGIKSKIHRNRFANIHTRLMQSSARMAVNAPALRQFIPAMKR